MERAVTQIAPLLTSPRGARHAAPARLTQFHRREAHTAGQVEFGKQRLAPSGEPPARPPDASRRSRPPANIAALSRFRRRCARPAHRLPPLSAAAAIPSVTPMEHAARHFQRRPGMMGSARRPTGITIGGSSPHQPFQLSSGWGHGPAPEIQLRLRTGPDPPSPARHRIGSHPSPRRHRHHRLKGVRAEEPQPNSRPARRPSGKARIWPGSRRNRRATPRSPRPYLRHATLPVLAPASAGRAQLSCRAGCTKAAREGPMGQRGRHWGLGPIPWPRGRGGLAAAVAILPCRADSCAWPSSRFPLFRRDPRLRAVSRSSLAQARRDRSPTGKWRLLGLLPVPLWRRAPVPCRRDGRRLLPFRLPCQGRRDQLPCGETEGLAFEAVEQLAGLAGMTMPARDPPRRRARPPSSGWSRRWRRRSYRMRSTAARG